MWAVRRPHGSAWGCQGRHRAGTVWGARHELSSLQGAGIPGRSHCTGAPEPSVIPTGAGSGGREMVPDLFSPSQISPFVALLPGVAQLSGRQNRPQAQRVREGSLKGTQRVVTRLEAPRPEFGSQDAAPCPGARPTPAPWRLQLPGVSARHDPPLCK